MNRASAGVALAALILLATTSGCTTSEVAAPTASPSRNWNAKLAAFVHKYGSNPPSSPELTETQAHQVSARYADRSWSLLVQQWPAALRPTDSFVHWASNHDPDRTKCATAAGAVPEAGASADGTISTGSSGPATVEYSVGYFDCEMVRYPTRPSPWPNDAQIGYYYDYLTKYLVPCYQGHGAKVDPGMPTRSTFIHQWQFEQQFDSTLTRWQLTPPDAADAPDPTYDGKSAVCSATGPGDAQP